MKSVITQIVTLDQHNSVFILNTSYICKNDILIASSGDTFISVLDPITVFNGYQYEFRLVTSKTYAPHLPNVKVGDDLYILHNSYPIENKWKKVKEILQQL